MAFRKLYVGADHAGFALKEAIRSWLNESHPEIAVEDCGCFGPDRVDYPDFAVKVGAKVSADKSSGGLLFCGSGLGVCIAANKVDGIRATSAWDVTSASLSRAHNDGNVLCFGARLTGGAVVEQAIEAWLSTSFEGGRHQGRIEKIHDWEKN